MSIVESIPLQQKIAELEQRIEKLEKAHGVVYTHTTIKQTTSDVRPFGSHWKKMWEEFDAAMKELFE